MFHILPRYLYGCASSRFDITERPDTKIFLTEQKHLCLSIIFGCVAKLSFEEKHLSIQEIRNKFDRKIM